uniref:Neur_chan_LBD domain-containing protein n=1 Tax=Ascaris lumbricoides TaxID=6252 RepID=A0A0M3IAR9_ASCLU
MSCQRSADYEFSPDNAFRVFASNHLMNFDATNAITQFGLFSLQTANSTWRVTERDFIVIWFSRPAVWVVSPSERKDPQVELRCHLNCGPLKER